MAEQSQHAGKLPIPALAPTEKQAKRIKVVQERKAAAEEKKAATKEKAAVQKKSQNKTRICIGAAFERWRKLKAEKGLRSDAEVAVLLLDHYDRDRLQSTPSKSTRKRPPPPSSVSSLSRSEREDDDKVTDPQLEEPHEAASALVEIREEEYFQDVQLAPQPSTSSASNLMSEPVNQPKKTVQELQFPPQESAATSFPEPTAPYHFEISMSSLDLNDPIDAEEFNSLHNARIEWEDNDDEDWHSGLESLPLSSSEENVTREFDSEGSDDDYTPQLCVRPGGALKVTIDHLPVISLDDSVHDMGDDNEESNPQRDEEHEVDGGPTILQDPVCIAYHMALHHLVEHLQLPENECKKCGTPKPFAIQISSRGTAAIITWICTQGHTVWKWSSQPYLNNGMLYGDFLLSCNLLFSGNNYAKIKLLFKFMNMGMVNRTTFHKIQDLYCIDTITEFWDRKRSEGISRLQTKAKVVVLGDGRMDSPGYCAQYCTYTVMDNDSKEIINVVNMDKRQTGRNSVIMEREAFILSVDKLREELNLSEICTDAHIGIASLFTKGKYKDSGVIHSFDMWHGAKNLGKKISAAAQQKECSILNQWNTHICNHFWYCCENADDYDTFFDKWSGVIHHVTDSHRWILNNGGCDHDMPLSAEERDMPWIVADSTAHQRLREIVFNERWLKSVYHYLTFRSTAELESFHNHMLMYAAKRFAFSPPAYGARMLLAALDYNHHVHRLPKLKADQSESLAKAWSKKSKGYRLVVQKEDKNYSYIPELQNAVLQKRLSSGGMPSKTHKRPDDARKLGRLCGVPAPSIEELLQQRASRAKRPSLPEEDE